MSQPGAMSRPSGPPYRPAVAALGGVPTIHTDVPITAVFLFLFLCGGAAHMTVFQKNKARGHKFIMSGVMFGFCMSRILTTVLRIALAAHPHNTSLFIAAQIFLAAGVVLLYVINLLFAQRIVRATHPNLGWHRAFSYAFKCLYTLIVVFLIMTIVPTVLSFYTLDLHKKNIYRRIQLSAQTYYTSISFLPIPLVILALIVPRKAKLEKFGSGRWRTKISILLVSSAILFVSVLFKLVTNFQDPRPANNPAWYQSKTCFYLFNFTTEILVIYLYFLVRVDRRFHVPDGSHKPGDYSRKLGHSAGDGSSEGEKKEGDSANAEASSRSGYQINTEEEVFDDEDSEDTAKTEEEEIAARVHRMLP